MKSFNLNFKKNPFIIYCFIIILLLFVIFFISKIKPTFYYVKEGMYGNNILGNANSYNNLSLQSGLVMKVSVNNTYKNISDPNPNQYYKATIDTFNKSAYMKGNNQAILPYYFSKSIIDTSNISLSVEPATTNIIISHNADVFPRTFQIDVYVDMSNSSMQLDDKSYAPIIKVDKDGVLNAKNLGIINDYSMNRIGYVKRDISDPTHYFVTIFEPTTSIKKVTFTWNLIDLCQNNLPDKFLGNCSIYGNCVSYSFDKFYNSFSGFSYLENTDFVNTNSLSNLLGNTLLGNTSVNSSDRIGKCLPGSLCSGVYQVAKN